MRRSTATPSAVPSWAAVLSTPAAVALIAACFVLVAIARVSLVIVMPIALTVGILFSSRGKL